MIDRMGKSKKGLQNHLGMGGVKQIPTSVYMAYTLPGIVDHHGEMVGDANVLSPQNDITVSLKVGDEFARARSRAYALFNEARGQTALLEPGVRRRH